MAEVRVGGSDDEGQYAYWAFISYAHLDNRAFRGDGDRDHIEWATWLHGQIEAFAIPGGYQHRRTPDGHLIAERLTPVFRDETDLAASPSLHGRLTEALRLSRFLIVIASPRSAGSPWVNEEVRYFGQELGRGDRILTLIVDGEPPECFCPELRVAEPIAADVRLHDTRATREMRASERRQPACRAVIEHGTLKLIAGLMGVPLDDLVQRHRLAQLERERRARRSLVRWLVLVGLLAAVAAVAGLKARTERAGALRLAAQSEAAAALRLAHGGEEAQALGHAVRALEIDAENPLAAQLAYSLAASGTLCLPQRLLVHDSYVTAMAFSPCGRFLATGCDDGSVFVTDLESGERRVLRRGGKTPVDHLAFRPDGQAVALATRQAFGSRACVYTWQFLADERAVVVSDDIELGVLNLAWPLADCIVEHSGRTWGSGFRRTQVFALGHGCWKRVAGLGDESAEGQVPPGAGSEIRTVVSTDPPLLGVFDIHDQGMATWYRLGTSLDIEQPSLQAIMPAPEVFVAGAHGVIVMLEAGDATDDCDCAGHPAVRTSSVPVGLLPADPDADETVGHRKLWWLDPHTETTGSLDLADGCRFKAISADGKRVVVVSATNGYLHELRTGVLTQQLWRNDAARELLALSQDGSAWVTRQGPTKVVMGQLGNALDVAISLPVAVRYADLDPSGRWLALAGGDGHVRVWSRDSLSVRPLAVPSQPAAVPRPGPPAPAYRLVTERLCSGEASILDLAPGHHSHPTPLVPQPEAQALIRKHRTFVTGHCFTADGQRIAVSYGHWSTRPDAGSPSVAVLFDTATGQAIGQPLEYQDRVFSPVFAPDGTWFAAISEDRTVRLADTRTGAPWGQPLCLPTSSRLLQVSPHGDLLVTGAGCVISVAQWRVIRELTGNVAFDAIFFSPDQRWMASVSRCERSADHPNRRGPVLELGLWDVQTGLRMAPPRYVQTSKVRSAEYDRLLLHGTQGLTKAEWLEPGRVLGFGIDGAWACAPPCDAKALLPLLRAYRPVIIGGSDPVTNTNWSEEAISVEECVRALGDSAAARTFAEQLLQGKAEQP